MPDTLFFKYRFLLEKSSGHTLCILVLFWFLGIFSLSASIPALDSNQFYIDKFKRQLLIKDLPDTARIDILNNLSIYLHYKNSAESISYAKEALALCNKIGDDERKFNALTTSGNGYFFVGNYSQALFYFLQALRIWGGVDKEKLYDVSNNISICYLSLGQYKVAEKYLLAALNDADSAAIQKYGTFVSIYMNLGVVASNLNEYDKALEYYQEALKICKKKSQIGNLYLNIGNIYDKKGQFKEALEYYNKVRPILTGDAQQQIAYYNDMGKLYMDMGDFTKSEEYFFLAKDFMERSKMTMYETEVYENMYKMYAEKKDYKKAYEYLEKYKTLREETFNQNTTQRIVELQESYELEKRDNEILLLSQNQQIAESRLRIQLLVVFLLLFAALVVIFVGRNLILKQRVKNKILGQEKVLAELKNQETEKANAQLQNENTEARYEILRSKTNPHFLFNSLNTLTNIVLEDQEKAVEYIESFSALYRMILKTESQNLVTLKEEMLIVNNYIYLQKMRFGDKLLYEVNLMADTDYVLVPPFALQLAVENAIKHNIITDSKRLSLSIMSDDRYIIISNNLQKKHGFIDSTGTGQRSITERYKLLTDHQPEFVQTETTYTVKLPMLYIDKISQKRIVEAAV